MTKIEEYPDAAEAVRVKTEIFSSPDEMEEMSNDFQIQLVRDCRQVCELYDVPREDRIDLICDCIRQEMYEMIDREVEQFRWSLDALSGL